MSHITTTSQAVSHEVGVEDLKEKIKGLSKAGIEVGSKKHFNEQEVNPKKHFNKQAEAVAAAMRAAIRGQDVQKVKRALEQLKRDKRIKLELVAKLVGKVTMEQWRKRVFMTRRRSSPTGPRVEKLPEVNNVSHWVLVNSWSTVLQVWVPPAGWRRVACREVGCGRPAVSFCRF